MEEVEGSTGIMITEDEKDILEGKTITVLPVYEWLFSSNKLIPINKNKY